MTVFRVIVVARTIQIGRHGADGIETVLFTVGLTHLDAGDLGQSIGVIGRFQSSGEQVFFLDGLGAQLGIDTG